MRFGRLMAVTGIVSLGVAGGLYTFTPPAYGQTSTMVKDGEQRREVGRKQDRVVIRKRADGPSTTIQGFPPWDEGARMVDDLVVFDGRGAHVGLAVRDVEASDTAAKKLAGQAGALVEEVRKESAGAKAGVKTGDVIVSFDGERVRGARQLDRLVDETPAGRVVKMTVMRDGAKVDMDITPESSAPAMNATMTLDRLAPDSLAPKILERRLQRSLPTVEAFPAMPLELDKEIFAFGGGRGRLGVQVDGVEDQLAAYFGVSGGLLVRHVAEDSPAAKAGVKAGDVITAIAGKPVKEASDIRVALDDQASGQVVEIAVTRDKKAMSLKATIESPEKTRPRVRRTI